MYNTSWKNRAIRHAWTSRYCTNNSFAFPLRKVTLGFPSKCFKIYELSLWKCKKRNMQVYPFPFVFILWILRVECPMRWHHIRMSLCHKTLGPTVNKSRHGQIAQRWSQLCQHSAYTEQKGDCKEDCLFRILSCNSPCVGECINVPLSYQQHIHG